MGGGRPAGGRRDDIRAALADEALAAGLKGRIEEMQGRLDRLQDRAAKRRQIAKDVMVELDLKKVVAPDFTASIRPGMAAVNRREFLGHVRPSLV